MRNRAGVRLWREITSLMFAREQAITIFLY